MNLKKAWYEKNKAFLRDFEKTLEFKVFRNQRMRVSRLKKQLQGEGRALKLYKSRMLEAKKRFSSVKTG